MALEGLNKGICYIATQNLHSERINTEGSAMRLTIRPSPSCATHGSKSMVSLRCTGSQYMKKHGTNATFRKVLKLRRQLRNLFHRNLLNTIITKKTRLHEKSNYYTTNSINVHNICHLITSTELFCMFQLQESNLEARHVCDIHQIFKLQNSTVLGFIMY